LGYCGRSPVTTKKNHGRSVNFRKKSRHPGATDKQFVHYIKLEKRRAKR